MSRVVYLDNAATTPVDPSVAEKMLQFLTPDGEFGNPASNTHGFGWRAEEAVDIARNQVAELINADPREIVWTSGATEADNLAIKGVAEQYADQGKHIITSATEHKAVIDTCKYLQTKGFEVTFLKPDHQGIITAKQVADALRGDTILVSIMLVNNELGVVQDIAGISQVLADHPALLHVDAAQAAGKMPLDMAAMGVDLASFSGHKVYGPKGIGCLYVRRSPDVRLVSQMHGGGHERGMRSGTLATHQIVGMGEACRLAGDKLASEPDRLRSLRQQFLDAISQLDGVTINGHPSRTVPGILNIRVEGIDAECLLASMNTIAISTGSACNSASVEPSFVLTALGLSRDEGLSSLRISFGRFNDESDVKIAAQALVGAVSRIRSLSLEQ